MVLASLSFILASSVSAQVQSPIFSEDKNPSFSSIYHVDSVSNTTKDSDFFVRVNRNAPFNCSKETCPASIIINNKTGAVNMVAPVKVNSLHVGGQQVIDGSGNWTGPSTGLIGPKGDDGPKGDTGEKGDSCSIQGSDIVCGITKTPLAALKGSDGRTGDSCSIQGSDIVCGTTKTPLSALKGSDGRNGDNCAIQGADIVCGATRTPLTSLKGADGRNGDNCSIQGSDIVCGATQTSLAALKGADGRNGDNCSIQGSDIVCGATKTPLAALKGADGRSGDNCAIQGSDIVCGATKTPLAALKGADGRNGDNCTIQGSDIVCGAARTPLASLKGADGRNGDNCSIQGSDIVCGATRTPLTALKGADGRNGESCVPGTSIYPACLDSLVNQNLFKMIYSETVSQNCQFASVGYQKKFTSTCPASHPNAIGGGCELRQIIAGVNLTSSEALKTGKGWQCELISEDEDPCTVAILRVWTTCSRMAIDYSSVQ